LLQTEPLKERLDQGRDRGFAREPAPHQAAIDQHPPKSRIEAGLGRRGVGPEAVEMALVGQSRHVVDRFADRAHGSARGKRERRRSAVHAHQSSSNFHQILEVASVDEMKPVLKTEPLRVPPHELAPWIKAAVEGVRLEKQMVVAR
jgi:hypothetical protein